jgi:hypothetical protein
LEFKVYTYVKGRTLFAMILEMVHNAVMATVTEIMDHVLALSRTDRSYLATKLIESLDDDSELSPEWIEEIERRVARRQSGETHSVSSSEVHREIEQILSR